MKGPTWAIATGRHQEVEGATQILADSRVKPILAHCESKSALV